MKINNFIKPILVMAFINIGYSTKSQVPLPCGNGRIDDSALNVALRFEQLTNQPQFVSNLVRGYFHVFSNDDGTQIAATSTQISNEFTSLLASYAADNTCFLFAGIDNYNSTALNQNFNADNDPAGTALAPYQVPGCINIFYMRKINGNNNACNPPCGYGGIALGGIPGTFFLVATGNIGPGNTIGHEMGHSLGLLHTFEKVYGYENINGSNSSTAGDKVTDTNADPFAYNGNACYSTNTSNCSYTGTCQDPNGATNFSPPYSNLMAYWWVGNSGGTCVVNPTATNGQFTRVNSFIATNSALINCSSPSNLTLSGVNVSSGYYMNSAINTLNTSGTVNINLSTIATLGGGLVQLEPGFHATPNSSGFVHVITKPCN